jgi:hypothetical protein
LTVSTQGEQQPGSEQGHFERASYGEAAATALLEQAGLGRLEPHERVDRGRGRQDVSEQGACYVAHSGKRDQQPRRTQRVSGQETAQHQPAEAEFRDPQPGQQKRTGVIEEQAHGREIARRQPQCHRTQSHQQTRAADRQDPRRRCFGSEEGSSRRGGGVASETRREQALGSFRQSLFRDTVRKLRRHHRPEAQS